ncbi:hypothetical protein [Ferruginivarius sediminum]|uniref:hypothetical protein n=1 Tax=Ferruginivarius sediminum TaxID=2661937 RepID=UPI0011C01A9B|nr:hypothetical protein [Ferruginivarius sediminum]
MNDAIERRSRGYFCRSGKPKKTSLEPIPTRISLDVLPMLIAGFERGGCGSPDNATQFRWNE